jgi:class I lanthipeptide synthase
VAADRSRLRAGLAAALDRPEVRDALFVASPDLHDSLALWRGEPESKKGQRTEKALVRYFQRMTGRATPFGLFSGCSVGRVGEQTRLEIAGLRACRRHSRLDMDYLAALAQDLDRDPALRAELLYRPNSSLYRAAGRLRYAEARMRERRRSYFLVAVEVTPYLEATLRRAAGGARRCELAAALVAEDPDGEIALADAEEYVDSLIDAQILVSDLSPLLTGPEPVHDLIARLRAGAAGSRFAGALEGARQALAGIDAGGLGAPPESYLAVARGLGALPTRIELPRLFQVDMVKPEGFAVLGADVLAELGRAVELLLPLSPGLEEEGLERFRAAFVERYGEGAEVPLTEALDEEVGIGFELTGESGSEPSPLLEGLAPPPRETDVKVPWGARCEILLRKVEEAHAQGRREIELTADDVRRLSGRGPFPRPRAFAVLATLAARSQEALDAGDFRLLFHYCVGPSAARLLGRFCHGDEALRREVERHLREEEALAPDAIFAEVVHLPEGRLGNVLCRPRLREHEIPYLGRSGAAPEHQIPVSDLRVTVAGERIHLRSARLGRRVIPRLTSAHNYHSASLRIYRFLCKLQNQGLPPYLIWKWEPLTALSFLPRLRSGRVVISRARWLVTGPELEALGKTTGAERFRAVQLWRAERRLPRFVVLADWDNELTVDLDNVLSIDSFVDLARQRPAVFLVELFPPPEELCARGPEGRFVHELLVPFCDPPEATAAETAPPPSAAAIPGPAVRRSFTPGSEWLYAKLYAGTATADLLLRELVSPLRRWALDAGAADRWFFIRYGDPDWHLRLRFHGDPERLWRDLLPRLAAAAEELRADGRLRRLQLDTYDREVERYGGAAGIGPVERLFEADSEAVLEIVEAFAGDGGADARWRLAFAGIHTLLADLGLDFPARLELARRLRDRTDYAHQLCERFRRERSSLEALVEPSGDGAGELAPGLAVLRRRSAALAPVASELRSLERQGRLLRPVAALAPSFLHMHVNRMMRAAAGEHERVLYDFLARVYESRAARAGGPL